MLRNENSIAVQQIIIRGIYPAYLTKLVNSNVKHEIILWKWADEKNAFFF